LFLARLALGVRAVEGHRALAHLPAAAAVLVACAAASPSSFSAFVLRLVMVSQAWW